MKNLIKKTESSLSDASGSTAAYLNQTEYDEISLEEDEVSTEKISIIQILGTIFIISLDDQHIYTFK